ncbi:MAG: hypothetical protein ACTHMG_01200 [Sphingomonas sp.]
MRKLLILPVALLPLATGGCLVRTAANVATLPVKATGKAIDWTTTSQSEADRNYGRKMRKEEAKEGRERRKWEQQCHDHPDAEECQNYTGYRAGYDR